MQHLLYFTTLKNKLISPPLHSTIPYSSGFASKEQQIQKYTSHTSFTLCFPRNTKAMFTMEEIAKDPAMKTQTTSSHFEFTSNMPSHDYF